MSNLLDTNVLSEIRKGARCDANVAAWFRQALPSENYVSALALGEIRSGIPLREKRDPAQAAVLETWLGRLVRDYGGKILPVDERIAQQWGRLQTIRPLPVIDALMAATAIVHGLTFVTRDVGDLKGVGVRLLNPFGS